MLAPAIERGAKIEICYSPGIMSSENNARRNLISNATQLIRATRGRGLIISSEASKALACRGPMDVINLAAVWGLGQERGREAVTKHARSVVVSSQMKRTSFRGVIDVVYGGEKRVAAPIDTPKPKQEQKKRKASAMDPGFEQSVAKPAKLSNREQKRQRKALLESQQKTEEGTSEQATGSVE